jgi:hypothetical protein
MSDGRPLCVRIWVPTLLSGRASRRDGSRCDCFPTCRFGRFSPRHCTGLAARIGGWKGTSIMSRLRRDFQVAARLALGWHARHLPDLPIQGAPVTLELRSAPWKCRNEQCARKTFVGKLGSALPFARRTRRVEQLVSLFGHAAGGRTGERLLTRLAMPVSDSTILRQLEAPRPRAPRHRTAAHYRNRRLELAQRLRIRDDHRGS